MAGKRVRARVAVDNLPVALTPLLGRERELDDTARLLSTTRLLTITGAGGSGKTRLALELARRARSRFADGVVWVDLAPIAEPDLIAQQLLTALGMRELPTRDVLPIIVDRLRERAHLLVLDNCEHLVDAVASIADAILRTSEATSIVATSREALGVHGEQTWLVPPLAQDDAIRLFDERARAVLPSFAIDASNAAAVRQICQRLDGIPLAIELAAARVKVLSVSQIAERLADAFRLLSSGSRTVPRHRTIRETIDWSYRLLGEHEQTLLRRLAVFAGSFSLEAAEAVCAEDDVLELISALVDKSLVLRERAAGEARYRLLETVRQFAAEKLEQSAERERFRERHARYFFELIEAAEPRVFAGAVDLPTMARLDQEIGNLRAVFDWTEQHTGRSSSPADEANIELRMIYALHWYWFARGHFHEARRRIEAALARAHDADPNALARARVALGDVAVWQADWRAVRPSIDQAIAVLRHAGDLRPLAMGLTLLGAAMAFGENDHVNAKRVFEDAKETARRHGRDVGYALALYWAGLAAQLRGDLASARAMFDEGCALADELRNLPAIGHMHTVRGHLSFTEGKYDGAIGDFRRALEAHSATDDRWGLTQVIEGIGLALLELGDAEVGTRLLAAAEAAWLQLGARPSRHEDYEHEKDERIRRAVSDERLRVVLASGAAMPYDEMLALAREHVARLGTRDGGKAAAKEPALRVRALGPLEIYRDGQPVDAASQSGRSRELLLFLLCNPKGATKEQIGAALWPDADPSKLRNNFHVTLHRLRKSLGSAEWIVANDETYTLDRSAGVDFDVETFEREAKNPARLPHAIELYRGDFFQNATAGEWHLDLRDRLRDLYARALTSLGRTRMKAGEHAEAAEVYGRLVALDEFDEEAVRNLMSALAAAGDRAGAGRAYRRLVEVLERELETEPEPETVKLYGTLARGAS